MTDGLGRELAEQEYDVKWSYWQKCLVLCHALSNIEITNYFNFEPLPQIKYRVFFINTDGKQSKITHQVSLLIDRNIFVSLDSIKIQDIPKQALSKIYHSRHI